VHTAHGTRGTEGSLISLWDSEEDEGCPGDHPSSTVMARRHTEQFDIQGDAISEWRDRLCQEKLS